MTAPPRVAGFRLGICVFKKAEILDFAAPYGVFSVTRRFDPEVNAFLVADALGPVQAQAGFTVLPNYSFAETPRWKHSSRQPEPQKRDDDLSPFGKQKELPANHPRRTKR